MPFVRCTSSRQGSHLWSTSSRDGYACSDGCTDGLPACPVKMPYPQDRMYAYVNATGKCYTESDMQAYIGKVTPTWNTRTDSRAARSLPPGPQYGPLTIELDADNWQGYTGGIVTHHCGKSPDSGDHAVQLVGYGTETSVGKASFRGLSSQRVEAEELQLNIDTPFSLSKILP